MTIAITTANGQLGSAVVSAVVARVGTSNVVALARTPEKAQHLGVEVRPGDYDDRVQLTTSLQGIDGPTLSQSELAKYIGALVGVTLTYRPMSDADYLVDRTSELGDFFGPVIAGIYQGIREGANDTTSDFAAVVGRPHTSWDEYFASVEIAPPVD
ncbi:hypothetical protein [Microbacterium marmarense]|uniref:Uncharacterized protein n=1 Tax=Microbacterium marmarense TaxID=3122051 RepID=A0ABU8LSS5_9MICO